METAKTSLEGNTTPHFLKLLFFVELWERFSYYGMRSLLILFLTSQLAFADENACAIYALFAAIGYAGPVLGGFLADKLMGFRNMVLLGGITLTIGHMTLMFVSINPQFIYYGLGLIAVGVGMFKGNITNLLGSCYEPGQDKERSRGFTLFYVSVNIGGFMAAVSCGYVAHIFGWHYGFGLAGFGMLLGLVTFIKFQHVLGRHGTPPKPELMQQKYAGIKTFPLLFIATIISSTIVANMLMYSTFFANMLVVLGTIILCILAYIMCQLSPLQRKSMIVLLILIMFKMCFFAIEMQLGSVINLFTARNVVDHIFGIPVPAAVSQALNPFSVMILGTVIGLYMKFNKKYATARFGFGILTMAISMFTLYIGCIFANDTGHVEYIYLVLAIAVMALGELSIAPIVQEQATILAPPHLKGFVMGIVMLSLAFANLAGILIIKFMAVPSVEGKVDSITSLAIYQKGFFEIGVFNFGLFVIFLIFYKFINSVITRV